MSVTNIAKDVNFKAGKENNINSQNIPKRQTQVNFPQPDYKGSIIVAASVSAFVETFRLMCTTFKEVSDLPRGSKNLFNTIVKSVKTHAKPHLISFAAWAAIFSVINCTLQYFLYGRNK